MRSPLPYPADWDHRWFPAAPFHAREANTRDLLRLLRRFTERSTLLAESRDTVSSPEYQELERSDGAGRHHMQLIAGEFLNSHKI
jgi:hypothetical protein